MIYGPCNNCESRHLAYQAKVFTPCCLHYLCDRCLSQYVTCIVSNDLPLDCPGGCGEHLGWRFIGEEIEERPNDQSPYFLYIKEIFEICMEGPHPDES